MNKKNLSRIAVYGTLKQGRGNHDYFLQEANLVSKEAQTVNNYAMYSSGIPYVVKDEQTTQIQCEIYDVDEWELQSIDGLEGHPNWYKREEIDIKLEDGSTTKAWMYFMPLTSDSKKNLKKHLNGVF